MSRFRSVWLDSDRFSPLSSKFESRAKYCSVLGVNPRKHVWSGINQLNKILTGLSRHDYYSVSNWELKVKPLIESAKVDRIIGKL